MDHGYTTGFGLAVKVAAGPAKPSRWVVDRWHGMGRGTTQSMKGGGPHHDRNKVRRSRAGVTGVQDGRC